MAAYEWSEEKFLKGRNAILTNHQRYTGYFRGEGKKETAMSR